MIVNTQKKRNELVDYLLKMELGHIDSELYIQPYRTDKEPELVPIHKCNILHDKDKLVIMLPRIDE